MKYKFKDVSAMENDPKWNNIIKRKKELYQAIIYYISGMTDNYAIDTYNKIIRF